MKRWNRFKVNTAIIAVIIPFFQREAGILGRALASIAKQNYPLDALYVIVVDDSSPLPAAAELQIFPPPNGLRVKVILQPNTGPGEARNTGLNNLEPGTHMVAYLDSDDEWLGDHLAQAVRVLAHGYSAYFANLYHLGDGVNEFEKAQRVRPGEHTIIENDPTLRAYQGDMVHQIATANIIFMPTLVIDVTALGQARFPKAHRHGGEDYLYWLDLIQHRAKFAFSTVPEVRCGKGLNMWSGSGWGTDGYARRLTDEARFRKTALEQHATSDITKDTLKDRLIELQVGLLQDTVHRLKRHRKVDWKNLRTFFSEHPFNVQVLKKILKKYSTNTQ